MNVREEDRQKNSCPSRGLGLAAAAIGVGVGAALYYFFSKSPENPDGEGSTSGWNTEQPHALTPLHDDSVITISDDSYTTISEHSTTDTSIHESHDDSNMDPNSDSDESDRMDSDESNESDHFNIFIRWDQYFEDNMDLESSGSDIETEWDVTDTSTDLPEDTRPPRTFFWNQLLNLSPMRERNRERTWSLEECSICFDVILKDQKVTTLPCTHHFHSECITPWLQEQQTCPNCRKAAE